jgi:hypothetical protein
VRLDQLGVRRWITLPFPQSVIVNAQPYWIVMRTTNGAAVWLTSPGTEPLRVFAGEESSPTELSRLQELQALFSFHSSQLSMSDTPPVRLFVNGQLAPAGSQTTERRQFDIRAALNAGQLPAGPGKRTIALEFVSALRGSVTVYPPTIDYDLNE